MLTTELAAALRMSLEADAASGGAGPSFAEPAAAPPALTSAGWASPRFPRVLRPFCNRFAQGPQCRQWPLHGLGTHQGRRLDRF